jgi:membrane fusion protein (multidrug efflux system)
MYTPNTKALLIPTLLLSFASTAVAEGAPQGLPAEVITLKERAVNANIYSIGTLEADESVLLRPELTGKIIAIPFQEGGKVKKGDILVQLDDAQYRAQVAEAEARVKQSDSENRRVEKLFNRGVGSETDRDGTQATMKINTAQLDMAKINLEKTRIRAPFDGITGLRQFSPGDYINAGSELVQLVNIDKMKVDFSIPEIHLLNVSVGQAFSIRLPSFPGREFVGKVSAISPVIDEKGRSISVRGMVDNKEGVLRPGLFAEVILTTDSKTALSVPEEALIPQGNQYFVYRVVEQKIDMVPITIIQRKQGAVAISGPLNSGDVIVTAGQLKLQPGSPVTPMFVDGSQPAPGAKKEAATEGASE